ncbi:STAS domain-containing protein [Embleya sp. NBC_00896]|uniref:STAS domain-containing protein n=1 Tax=Embleya sp. NBC_00896 TaxID=2975961 RepID=UPI00386664B6|nr:STAS domain-containing protein [Embleya sp. NBC_00896]
MQPPARGDGISVDYADDVLRVERTSPLPGVRLAGEVDLDNCAHVRSALIAQSGVGGGDLRVDVSSLCFIDVAGMRTLVETALMLDAGRRLVLSSASEDLCTLVELAGWDRVPGLVLETVTTR